MEKYKINGTVIWQPDKDLALSFATTYTESSQRTQYGVGYFTPMFTVEQYTYKASDIPMTEATKILQMIAKGYKFTLHYFSPYYGVCRFNHSCIPKQLAECHVIRNASYYNIAM